MNPNTIPATKSLTYSLFCLQNFLGPEPSRIIDFKETKGEFAQQPMGTLGRSQ